jgi:hypothetical protein
MLDVPANGYLQPVDMAEPVADRGAVQQCLGRMFVGPVAGIDDRRFDDFGNTGRRAIVAMPDDERVRTHGVERPGSILESLALLHRAMLNRERDRRCPEAMRGSGE